MTSESHREKNAIFSARRLGTGLLASVVLFSFALAFGVIYDLGMFNPVRCAQAQQSSDRGMIPTGYETDSLAEWHVFLAATNIYTDEIGELKYAENDVDELVKIFSALGVKDENLIVLKSSNKDPYKTTSQRSIERNYKRFIDGLTSNSIAFVFLSGHGFTDKQSGGAYYAPLDFVYDYFDETKISIDDMMSQLADSSARFKWMCVDACRNDLVPTVKRRADGKAKSLAIENVPKGVVLTQSCRPGQFSYEYGGSNAPFNNGLFTRAFVDAISGRSPEADENRDGVVTLGEIRGYLETRVPKDADKYCQGRQNPIFTTKDSSFDSIAQFPLFEDLPIFGHHPEEWREGQRLRREAEELVKQKKYREAGVRIQEAYRLLPDVDEIIQARERIKELYYANDPRHGSRSWYEKATAAYNAKKYQEALSYINKALELAPKNATYSEYKKLIQDTMGLYAGSPLNSVSEASSSSNQTVLAETQPGVETSTSTREAGELFTISIAGIETGFRWCPPGEFMMGSPGNEERRRADETLHKVVITRGFWLAETETSQALWHAVMGNDPSSQRPYRSLGPTSRGRANMEPDPSGGVTPPKPYRSENAFRRNDSSLLPLDGGMSTFGSQADVGNNPSRRSGDDLPVNNVSWTDCKEFTLKVCELIKSSGYTAVLPTEAQWEYACRAGTTTAYSWGNSPLGNVAFGSGFGGPARGRIDIYDRTNAWNLKNMHNKVWEWCQDWYGDYPTETVTDPIGPRNGSYRIIRGGGGLLGSSPSSRSAARNGYAPGDGSDYLGVRLALIDSGSN